MPMTFVPAAKLSVTIWGGGAKEAVTVCAVLRVTEQLVTPEQAFPQATNVLVPLGVAVSITAVPGAKLPLHAPEEAPPVVVHEIWPKLSVTVPLPVPISITVSGIVPPAGTNVALTAR